MALFDQGLVRPWRNTPLRAARSMRSLWIQHAPGRRPARVEDWMSSMKPDYRRCGRAGSMPRALRFQEVRTFCAGLSETTALVPSKRFMEGAIGWVGLDRSTGTHRVVGWVWADTLIQEAAGPRLDVVTTKTEFPRVRQAALEDPQNPGGTSRSVHPPLGLLPARCFSVDASSTSNRREKASALPGTFFSRVSKRSVRSLSLGRTECKAACDIPSKVHILCTFLFTVLN